LRHAVLDVAAAMLRGYPTSNVIVMVEEPSLELEDELGHPLHAVDLLFERRRHGIGDALGAGPDRPR